MLIYFVQNRMLYFRPVRSTLNRSNTGRKKAAAVSAALQADVREISERLESLAASAKRREKAQAAKEKAAALSRLMEVKRMQVGDLTPYAYPGLCLLANSNKTYFLCLHGLLGTGRCKSCMWPAAPNIFYDRVDVFVLLGRVCNQWTLVLAAFCVLTLGRSRVQVNGNCSSKECF